VITVAATDRNDARGLWQAGFASNFGEIVDIFAPGTNILSAGYTSNSATATQTGTSMASPHVAGLAAYLISLEGLSTPSAVLERLIALSTTGTVTGLNGSPNRLAFNGIA
jgi:subtilisin family serine protease